MESVLKFILSEGGVSFLGYAIAVALFIWYQAKDARMTKALVDVATKSVAATTAVNVLLQERLPRRGE